MHTLRVTVQKPEVADRLLIPFLPFLFIFPSSLRFLGHLTRTLFILLSPSPPSSSLYREEKLPLLLDLKTLPV